MAETIEAPTTTATAKPAYEDIESFQYIRLLFDRLADERILFHVKNSTDKSSAISTLLEVHVDSKTFTIDPPFSSTGTFHLEPDQNFAIIAHLHGTSVTFKTKLDEKVDDDGMKLYRCHFPAKLRYSQQRNNYRVETNGMEIPVRMFTSSGKHFQVDLVDISNGGMRVMMRQQIAAKMRVKTALTTDIHFDGDNDSDRLRAVVCNIGGSKTTKNNETGESVTKTLIGFKFVDMDTRQEGQLAHKIAKIERQLLRKNSDDIVA